MKNKFILPVLTFLVLFSNCKKQVVEGPAGPQGPEGDGFTHYVGEKFGGGIVFYVYRDANDEEHGLIASLSDVGTQVSWGLNGTDVPNCESNWNGQQNTIQIINAGAQSGDPAALCKAYNGGGFSDWYLPAIHELNTLGDNLYLINKTLETDNDPNSTPLNFGNSNYYWSSTEMNANQAVAFQFAAAISAKTNSYPVRAFRSF
ncbi:MAG: DUF1566 domain-containing protein [Bacteroidia bacterium]|nr:DUF1566 domain-containing protein [Bacteroidia bacterium]